MNSLADQAGTVDGSTADRGLKQVIGTVLAQRFASHAGESDLAGGAGAVQFIEPVLQRACSRGPQRHAALLPAFAHELYEAFYAEAHLMALQTGELGNSST